MPPEILNTLSYLMGLALMFNFGFFMGGYMTRRAIVNTFHNGLERVETLFTNLFKRGKNAKTQADRDGDATHYYDGVGVLPAEKSEKGRRQSVVKTLNTAAGLGVRTGAHYVGAGQKGREGIGGEACREEGDIDRAGTIG